MTDAEIIRKFCESMDRFVRIRRIHPGQVDSLFKGQPIRDKKAYKEFVRKTVLPDYEELLPFMTGNEGFPLLGEIVEQELYNICIKVNSWLDIREIILPDE